MTGRYTDQHPQFSDSNGVPLAGGEIEFFTVGNTGAGNRKNTFSDSALTTPNPNPISLDGSGRSVNAIFLDGSYNTIIRDSDLVQIDQVDNVAGTSGGGGIGSASVNLVADLKPLDTTAIKEAYALGGTVIGDGGQGNFYFNATSTESDNSISVIEPDVGGGRWLLQNNSHDSITTAQAAGTTDAITITTSPLATALDSERVFFVENTLGPNTITGVTFKIDATSTLALKRDNSLVLVVGDTGPVGYKMRIELLDDDSAYILSNPYLSITANIEDDAVTTAKINDLAVTTAKINALAVTTAKINSLAVTSAELGALAVTEAKINSLAVTEGKIGALAVTEAKIGALAVTEAKIGADAVTNAKLDNMVQSTLKGRASGAGTGNPTDLSAAQAKTLLSIANTDVSGLGTLAVQNTTQTSDYDNDSVTNAKLANMVQATIKGRASGAGTGDPTDLTASQGRTALGLGALAVLNSVTASQIDASAVDTSELAADAVTVDKITSPTAGATHTIKRLADTTTFSPSIAATTYSTNLYSMGAAASDADFGTTCLVAGVIRITFDHSISGSGIGTSFVRVVKNGSQEVEFSTTSTTFVSQTHDLTVARGDHVIIQQKNNSGSGATIIRNVFIKSGTDTFCCT